MNIIQIGCADANDKVSIFLKEQEDKNIICNVLMIDANPKCIDAAKEFYDNSKHNIEFINAAILDTEVVDEYVNFYIPINQKFKEMASLSKDLSTNLCNDDCLEIKVKAMSINDVFKKFDKYVDWICIDTEGYDCKIINSMNMEICKFKNMYFEIAHSDGICSFTKSKIFQDCFYKLKSFGYHVYVDPSDIWNAIAVKL